MLWLRLGEQCEAAVEEGEEEEEEYERASTLLSQPFDPINTLLLSPAVQAFI